MKKKTRMKLMRAKNYLYHCSALVRLSLSFRFFFSYLFYIFKSIIG
jgi:hypothetical protein